MAEPHDPEDVPAPTPPAAGEPEQPGESADPLTAPSSTVGDEVHDAMVEEALGEDQPPA